MSKESDVIVVNVYGDLMPGSIIGSDIICYNTQPQMLTQATLPIGGDGVYNYQWQKRTVGSSSWQDIPTAQTNSYQPTILIETTDYRLKVINKCNEVYTDSVRIIVRPDITAAVIQGQVDTICYNTRPIEFSINTNPICGVGDSFAYQWQESIDGVVYVDIDGAISDKYQPEALTSDKYYRLRTTSVQGCGERYSNAIKVCVYSDLNITTQGIDPLCYMSQGDISVSAIGQGGLYTYQWYYSTNNTNFEEISGATNSIYKTESKVGGVYYYKCRVTPIKGCMSKESDVIVVNVYADVEPAIIGVEEQEVCYGDDAITLNIEKLPQGGDGKYIYVWQKSIDREKWVDLDIASSYQPKAMIQTTYYRLKVETSCGEEYSNIVVVKVNPLPEEQSIKGSSDVCYNQYEYYYVDELKDGFTYKWYLSNSNGEIVSADTDVDVIEVLWSEQNVTNTIVLEIKNNITGCIIENKFQVNVCGEKAPNRTIIVRKPNSDILVAEESQDIYYAWGYTVKTTGESVYIEDSNRRYVLLPYAYDIGKYDYWLRLQPTETSRCYSMSYYAPENDDEYVHPKSDVKVAYVKENISIEINNPEKYRVKCYLYSIMGQMVNYIDLGEDVMINKNIFIGLNKAMYILRVELGSEVLTFKLIAE